MQTPPRLFLEGWLEGILFYPEIAKLSSSEVYSARIKYVSDKQIMSNLWIAMYAFRRNNLV